MEQQLLQALKRILREESLSGKDIMLLEEWSAKSPENAKWLSQVRSGELPVTDIVFIEENEAKLEVLFNDFWKRLPDKQKTAAIPTEGFKVAANNVPESRYSDDNTLPVIPPAHRIHFLKRGWFRYAAALLAILAGIGMYTWIFRSEKNTGLVEITRPSDILPGGNRATLTLADGTSIMLDSAMNGTLARQGTTNIIKLNTGALAYKNVEKLTAGTEPAYNTIRTPKGGQYQVILDDGSKIWLNAESSVKFPTSFAGKTRSVTVTGEVYLEIAPNTSKPFSVQTGDGHMVEVLGTSFNINTYSDEEYLSTTLIDGSIRVHNDRQVKLLIPGQQSRISKTGNMHIDSKVDIGQIIAWKEGLFSFTEADLPAVMRQLSRWYNVEVVYAGKVPQRSFNGEIGRGLTLTQVMNLLSKTRVNYKIENGNKIVIYP